MLDHAEMSVIVAEDQEQVDKVAVAARTSCPSLRSIVYDDPRGMCAYDDPMLQVLRRACWRRGRALRPGAPRLLRGASSTKGGADDVAMIAYTSGTTGSPKGAMLSHAT